MSNDRQLSSEDRAKCPDCEGFGFIDHGTGNSHTCMICGGSGTLPKLHLTNRNIPSKKEVDGPCCAHLHVSYLTSVTNGITRGWWACDDCDMHFAPVPFGFGVFPVSDGIAQGTQGPAHETAGSDPRMDRLWEIHKIATQSRVLPEDVDRIARLSEGYAPAPKASAETREPRIHTLVREYIKDGALKLPPKKMGEVLALIGPAPAQKVSAAPPAAGGITPCYPNGRVCDARGETGVCEHTIAMYGNTPRAYRCPVTSTDCIRNCAPGRCAIAATT